MSPSPPPPVATEAESPSCNGINKRGSSAMDSGKPPRASEVGSGQSQSGFCFGVSTHMSISVYLFGLAIMHLGRRCCDYLITVV